MKRLSYEKVLKKFKSVQLLAMSFALVILTGSLLLSLPVSNVQPVQPYLNNLFVSTSAVCVTGLTPIVLADQYSTFGKIVLMFLMQIGGLGLMSFLALFMTAARKRLNLAEKQILLDATSKTDMSKVPEYVKRIVKYTFFFESIGFILFSIRFIPDFGLGKGLFNALFLTISAFCNVGYDSFAPDSLVRYAADPLVSLTVTGLIITGGLGFMVWFDIRDHFKDRKHHHYRLKDVFSHMHLHTKVVLTMTLTLLGSGTLLILLLEYTNPETLAPYGFGTKLLISFFQSTTLRTAGFSTLNIAACRKATQFIMCIYMLIGGSPGGTAGGIKTTTFAVLVLLMHSALRNQLESNHVFKRQISRGATVKGFVILFLYMIALSVGIIIMCVSERKDVSFLAIVFECVSAIGTVGLSMSLTPMLTAVGKVVIILLMFIGRIGPVTMVLSFLRNDQKKMVAVSYPNEDIIIG